jgi:hypothetical protein
MIAPKSVFTLMRVILTAALLIVSLGVVNWATAADEPPLVISSTHTKKTCVGGDVAVQYGGAWTCRPRYVANGDGTVTDNLTGLMWEQPTTTCSGEVTCESTRYTWSSQPTPPLPPYGILPDGTLFTTFIAGLNGGDYYSPSAGLDVSAGPGTCFVNHCDWRIPTIAELKAIVDLSAPGCGAGSPCIDPTFGFAECLYWSSSSVPGYPGGVWSFYFAGPGADQFYGKSALYGACARAVRNGR